MERSNIVTQTFPLNLKFKFLIEKKIEKCSLSSILNANIWTNLVNYYYHLPLEKNFLVCSIFLGKLFAWHMLLHQNYYYIIMTKAKLLNFLAFCVYFESFLGISYLNYLQYSLNDHLCSVFYV